MRLAGVGRDEVPQGNAGPQRLQKPGQAWAPQQLQDLAQPRGLSVPQFAHLWRRARKAPVSWYVGEGGQSRC